MRIHFSPSITWMTNLGRYTNSKDYDGEKRQPYTDQYGFLNVHSSTTTFVGDSNSLSIPMIFTLRATSLCLLAYIRSDFSVV